MIRRKPRLLRRLAKSDINITPLIDILLVLLVIFMVITPVTPVGIQTNVPQPAPPVPSQSRTDTSLVVTMHGDGRITLNHDEVDAATIVPRLHDIFRTRQDRTLFVQASGDLVFNNVAQLIDAAKEGGAERIGLLSEAIK
jgi:biopolymer transport protein ExbD